MRKKSTPVRKTPGLRFKMVTMRAVGRKRRATRPLQRATKRARLQVGVSRAPTKGSKTRVTTQVGTFLNTRQLYSETVTDIPFGLAVNERQKDVVRIKGFKLKMCVRNVSNADPLMLRMAIVSPKNNTMATGNFFKGYDNDKGLDFNTVRSGIQFTTYGINDQLYNVIWQSKRLLAQVEQNDALALTDNRHNAQYIISKYVKLDRTLMWDSSADLEPSADRLFFIYWLDNPLAGATTGSVANVAVTQHEVITYYKDGN